jgi:hypothetical protein
MKIKLGTKGVLPFFDTGSVIALEAFTVRVDDPAGTTVATVDMTATDAVPDLYISAPVLFSKVGKHTATYSYGDDPVVVLQEDVDVGADPVSDFQRGVAQTVVLDQRDAGGVAETATVQVVGQDSKLVLETATRAVFTGNAAVSTIEISDGDTLTFKIGNGGAALIEKTAEFLATPATTSGAGTFGAGDVLDTAEYSVNGGRTRTVNLAGVLAGVDAYASGLNAALKGVYATNVGGDLTLTTDREGSSASILLQSFGGDFAAKTGLVEGTYGIVIADNTVANADAVTQAEVAEVLQADISDVAAEDLILVTWDADDNIVLTVSSGDTGIGSIIDLSAGTAGLITDLGLALLGTQGGGIVSLGTNGESEQALYDPDASAYIASRMFADEGQYFIVWLKENAQGQQEPFMFEPVLVLTPSGAELVKFRVATLEGNNGAAHTFTTVVISLEDGTQVDQNVTDDAGDVAFNLDPSPYVVSLVKTNTVFSTNNFLISVVNTREIAPDPYLSAASGTETQVYQLIASSFSPTVTAPISPAAMCLLYADIYRMTGTPLKHANVQVGLVHAPQLFDGTAVFDTQTTYKTDANGHVEFKLVQGIKIEVIIAPLSIRRIITVPSGADAIDAVTGEFVPVNILDLMSDADDVFDIIKIKTPTAPRRTL